MEKIWFLKIFNLNFKKRARIGKQSKKGENKKESRREIGKKLVKTDKITKNEEKLEKINYEKLKKNEEK